MMQAAVLDVGKLITAVGSKNETYGSSRSDDEYDDTYGRQMSDRSQADGADRLAGGSKTSLEEVDAKAAWHPLRRFTATALESRVYELLLAVIIIANAWVIISDVNLRAKDESDEQLLPQGAGVNRDADRDMLQTLGFYFLAFYAVEVAIRLSVYRIDFFFINWNLIDFSIVVLDIGAVIIDATLGTDEIPSLGVLRIVRLGRLARFVHILMIFKELHMMLHAFLSALRTIVWASMLLLILITLWSIVAVEVVHPVNLKVATENPDIYLGCERCTRAFESVWDSNLTFIQTIIAGDAWGRVSVPIIEKEPHTAIVLVAALVTINLGVLNLILTVIVNAAQEARNSDEKLLAQERTTKYKKLRRRLLRICALLDEDKDGIISLDDMYKALDTNAEFRASLEAMDIGRDDMEIFFSFIDIDGSGDVTYSEFVEQVFKMKSQDSVAMIVSLKGMIAQLNHKMAESCQVLGQNVQYMSRNVRRLLENSRHDGRRPSGVGLGDESTTPFAVPSSRPAQLASSASAATLGGLSDGGDPGSMCHVLGGAATGGAVTSQSFADQGSLVPGGAGSVQASHTVTQAFGPAATGDAPRGGAGSPAIGESMQKSMSLKSQPGHRSLKQFRLQVADMRMRLDNELATFVEDVMGRIESQVIARMEEPSPKPHYRAGSKSVLPQTTETAEEAVAGGKSCSDPANRAEGLEVRALDAQRSRHIDLDDEHRTTLAGDPGSGRLASERQNDQTSFSC